MRPIDEAFNKTTKLLFGKELGRIDDYGKWLTRRTLTGELCQSSTSEKEIFFPNYSLFKFIPKDRASDLGALQELSQKKINFNENDGLKEISQKLGGIATYIIEFVEGKNVGVIDSTIYKDLYHAYKVVDCFDSKYIGYNFWTDHNEYTFGVHRTFNSKFGIHIYNSKHVNVGFEVDSCKSCNHIYFCHNCENVQDSMFCFNTKNKRYAIGNIEVGREKYLEVKDMLVQYILFNLEKNKFLNLDIYNIGCKK